MTKSVEWQADHTTYPKGASFWGRALPYVIADGEGKTTIYGDWWDEARICELSAWEHVAVGAIALLMDDDEAQARTSRAAIVARRLIRESNGIAWSLAESNRRARDMVLTDDDRAAIAAELARRIKIREQLRAEVARWVRLQPYGRAAAISPGDPSTWPGSRIAEAAWRNGALLLRLIRAGLIPHPGELIPPHLRAEAAPREPAAAGAT